MGLGGLVIDMFSMDARGGGISVSTCDPNNLFVNRTTFLHTAVHRSSPSSLRSASASLKISIWAMAATVLEGGISTARARTVRPAEQWARSRRARRSSLRQNRVRWRCSAADSPNSFGGFGASSAAARSASKTRKRTTCSRRKGRSLERPFLFDPSTQPCLAIDDVSQTADSRFHRLPDPSLLPK